MLFFPAAVSSTFSARERPLCSSSWSFQPWAPGASHSRTNLGLFPSRSSQNLFVVHKCYIFLVFMVVILPSMGLTRYLPSQRPSSLSPARPRAGPAHADTVGRPVAAGNPFLS